MNGHKTAAIEASASIGSYGSLSYNPTYRDVTVHLVILATLRHRLISKLLENFER